MISYFGGMRQWRMLNEGWHGSTYVVQTKVQLMLFKLKLYKNYIYTILHWIKNTFSWIFVLLGLNLNSYATNYYSILPNHGTYGKVTNQFNCSLIINGATKVEPFELHQKCRGCFNFEN